MEFAINKFDKYIIQNSFIERDKQSLLCIQINHQGMNLIKILSLIVKFCFNNMTIIF